MELVTVVEIRRVFEMQTEAQRRFSELYKVIRKGLLKKSFTKDSVRGWLKMVGEREGRKAAR